MIPDEARLILQAQIRALRAARGSDRKAKKSALDSGPCGPSVQARQRKDERLRDASGGKKVHTMKLIIGNKNYSSWSLRGWLALKQSGLHFEEITVNIGGEEWAAAKKESGEIMPAGKVPILWDGDTVIWDSLAIMEYCADKVGRDRFWPKDDTARGMARSMVAEMHSSYLPLRRECPMNMRKRYDGVEISEDCRNDIVRILQLWAEARARFGQGGPYLFGTFGAADIFYAPVVSRFLTYGVGVPGFAEAYMQAVWEQEWMQQWLTSAEDEQWVLEQYEVASQAG
jgi:glutathione S-transferase